MKKKQSYQDRKYEEELTFMGNIFMGLTGLGCFTAFMFYIAYIIFELPLYISIIITVIIVVALIIHVYLHCKHEYIKDKF